MHVQGCKEYAMNPDTFQPDRRHFLTSTGLAAAVLAAHGCVAGEEATVDSSKENRPEGSPRIRKLELLSAAPLTKMKEFHHELLGLGVEEKSERLTIAAGETPITFRKATEEEGEPFYHFAFNIPENKIEAALDWQKKRTPLLPIPQTLRDPKFPDEVVNYSHWNAHSIFFFDPAGNVVEYIARHDLKNSARGEFASKDILNASEIAFVVDDVEQTVTALKEAVGVVQYKGASDQFAALGDERGLLLVMKRGRVISFDAKEKKPVTVFPTTAVVRGRREMKYAFPKFPYEISIDG
jgi:hypothetical protein